MKQFYTKHLHKIWMLCLCFCIIPGNLTYATGHPVEKITGTLIGAELSGLTLSSGDTIIVTGSALQMIGSGSSVWWSSDWNDLRTFISGAGMPLALVLETPDLVIPDYAFNGCDNLTSIYLPNVETLGQDVFGFCNDLVDVNVPNAENMGKYAFQYCVALTNVTLPKITDIDDGTFGHSGLTSISLPNVESIGNEAFEDCVDLISVDFPKVVTIGNNAFTRNSLLTDVSLPEALTIGNGAFNLCSSLTDINYPKVQTIGDWAFLGTNLESVVLPNVLSIGEYAFENCASLTSISIPKINSTQAGTFKNCTGLTFLYMPYVNTLGNSTFEGCTNLELVILHNLSVMGNSAFGSCPALKYLELGAPPTMPILPNTAFGGSTGAVLIVVPDTNAYKPFPLSDPPYSGGSEAHLKKVTTVMGVFDPSETLIPERIPNNSLAGTYLWKKDGYPIPGADDITYKPSSPGWYTLEFTYGGTITLLSVYLVANEDELHSSHARYETCPYTLIMTFTPSAVDRTVTVYSEGSGAAYVIDPNSARSFQNGLTYQIPRNKTMLEIPYEVAPEMGSNNQVQFVWEVSDYPITYSTDVFTLYASLEITYRYYRPTVNYAGLLEVDITGGSVYIQRSRDGGTTWEWARDTITGATLPFSQSQIYNIDAPYLIYRQLNSCTPYDTLWLSGGSGSNPLLRMVQMPSITGGVCSIDPGEYYVESQGDFTFTVTGIQAGYSLHVSTSREIYPDSEGGLQVVRNADGSYTVTILYIQEPVIVTMDFSVANSSIENMRIWGANGVLHLQATDPCEAWVHSISGAFVQSIRLSGGETFSLPLAKGIYFVTINGKTYKVIL